MDAVNSVCWGSLPNAPQKCCGEIREILSIPVSRRRTRLTLDRFCWIRKAPSNGFMSSTCFRSMCAVFYLLNPLNWPMDKIEKMLRETMGLDANSVGSGSIQRIIRLRMKGFGITDPSAYREHLSQSRAEWDELVEAV